MKCFVPMARKTNRLAGQAIGNRQSAIGFTLSPRRLAPGARFAAACGISTCTYSNNRLHPWQGQGHPFSSSPAAATTLACTSGTGTCTSRHIGLHLWREHLHQPPHGAAPLAEGATLRPDAVSRSRNQPHGHRADHAQPLASAPQQRTRNPETSPQP
jgi:hypothetical protein